MSTPSSKILMVLPLGSRSHKKIFTPLAEKLALKGHKVALVSAYEEKGAPSLPYRDIYAKKFVETRNKFMGTFSIIKLIEKHGSSGVDKRIMKEVLKNIALFSESFIRDPNVEEAWKFDPDVILLPAFMNECGLIFAKKFKVPFIYVTTSGLNPWISDLVGNPEHPAYVPNQYLPYDDKMTLKERTVNVITRFMSPLMRRILVLNKIDPVAKKFLQDHSVRLKDVEKGVSLVLVNSHHSLAFPRPLQPNVIEVGGMHCREPKLILENDIREFLDSSQQGSVVLFSFGSHMESTDLSLQKKQLFAKAFARLPYKIIWKCEDDYIEGLPPNVLLKKWIPQQDILGHPAVGVFLTHGGLLSVQEAIYHATPILGIPMFGDQPNNIKLAEKAGIAKSLHFETISEEQIIDSLTHIMNSQEMHEKIKQKSLALKDQETHPLDRAVFYTEYVIRHNGAKHLKSREASLSLVEYYFLDVISIVIVFVIISYKFCMYLFTYIKIKYGNI